VLSFYKAGTAGGVGIAVAIGVVGVCVLDVGEVPPPLLLDELLLSPPPPPPPQAVNPKLNARAKLRVVNRFKLFICNLYNCCVNYTFIEINTNFNINNYFILYIGFDRFWQALYIFDFRWGFSLSFNNKTT